MRLTTTAVLVALFVFAGIRSTNAQTDRATLEGTVKDATGAVVPGATVKITQAATGESQERSSNRRGYYLFPGLAIGAYAVTVSKPGFDTKAVDDIVLQVGETHTLDIPLAVGQVSEKVEVNAEAGPAERTSAASATVIDSNQIAELPVNGRDWSGLTLLAPFAQDDGGGDQRTIRFAGRARDDNNFSFDGVDAGGIQEQAQKSQVRLQVSEDAVAEYRVNSALYDAEYGTQAGGQINVVTKSGTNDFHGSAFGYLRNSIFDARNFNDSNGVLPFRMGQYGLTFGGPVQKDKTFFFLSYEGLRQLQQDTSSGLIFVPSASLVNDILVNGRNGQGPSPQMCTILQGFPWRTSTGSVGGCTPKIVFPDSAFTLCQTAAQCQLQLGSNDLATDVDQFIHPVQTTVHEDTWLVRMDHKFSDKTMFYGRAQRDISLVNAQIGVTVGLDRADTINHPANYLLALEHVFTSDVFNETKFYINRSPFHNPQSSTLPFAVNTNLFTGIPNESADIEIGSTYGVVDNLVWTRQRHAFKMGMEYRRVRLNQGQTANNNLNFSDDQSLISATLSNGISFIAPWCCHRLRRNFFMPYFEDEWKMTPTFTLTAGLRWEIYGAPTEATNRTTVFDFNQFRGACLGTGSGNAPFTTPIDPTTNQPIPCPTNPFLTNSDYRDVDPRLSLAWAPSALRGKTVIRTGFGLYHGAAQNDDLNAGLESDTFRVTVNKAIPLMPAYEQAIPDLSGLSGSKQANHPRALQREGRRNLYAEEWGLTIEHQLPSGFLLSTSYLGSRGLRLFSRGALNLCSIPVIPNSTDPSQVNDCVRPLDQYFPPPAGSPAGTPTIDPYGSVDLKHDIGSSSYHALGLSLERRFTSGMSLQTRYTFSHSINNGSVGGGEANGPENINCLACDKGPSVFDIRHNFVTDVVYDLPFGPGKSHLTHSGALGKIVGGWELSSVGMYHTGHPLTVSMNLPNNIGNAANPMFNTSCGQPTGCFSDSYLLPDGNDQTNQRPDIVPGVPLTLPGGGHNGVPLINVAAFQAPPVGANGNFTRFGNAGNGIIRALPSWQIDLALMKDTQINERFSVEFGMQAFNVLNHIQLGDPHTLSLDYTPGAPNNLVAASDFGVIASTVNFNNNNDNLASPNTGTGLPRQLQFMVRLRF
ncbi:MAG TPA: carboxypeptidase regulatory-like domain-containing protein [Candidatus Acidoferrales bacterium]|nr:carboxypeptidase regulatory-like domain-containing protein [Candidatus Acidoferrales bacterium]